MYTRQFVYLLGWLALMPAAGFGNGWDIIQNADLENVGLSQTDANTSMQAINQINLNHTLDSAIQDTTSNTINLTQTSGSNNRQAVNSISTATIVTSSDQSVTNTGAFNLLQANGSNNLQTGNLLEIATDSTGTHTQFFGSGSASFNQTGSSSNVQAGNAAIMDSGTVYQNFSVPSVSVSFNGLGTSPAVTQAANYLDLSGIKTNPGNSSPP